MDNTILLLVEHNIIISFPDTYIICWMMIYLVDSAIQSLNFSTKKFVLRWRKGTWDIAIKSSKCIRGDLDVSH